jgi:hypothetical protein
MTGERGGEQQHPHPPTGDLSKTLIIIRVIFPFPTGDSAQNPLKNQNKYSIVWAQIFIPKKEIAQ